jgi:mannose-1-phosphate guanylyltransferase
MARLSYDSEQLLGEIAASARRQLHKFTPRELTILLGAMAKVTTTAISISAVAYNHLASILLVLTARKFVVVPCEALQTIVKGCACIAPKLSACTLIMTAY